MTTIDMNPVDESRLEAFVGQAVADMGAAISGLLLHIGDRLGLYKAMAGAGPMTSSELAARTGTAERYVREWLGNQAAAVAAGVGHRTRFDVATAQELPDNGYDLVCLFDCLHDMGDPVGAARRIRQVLAPDGTLMLVEPLAGETLEHNLNAVGRTFYGLSTVICTPASLAQEVGRGLGAQAGELQLGAVLREAGFTRVRRATQTPFNLVLEARP